MMENLHRNEYDVNLLPWKFGKKPETLVKGAKVTGGKVPKGAPVAREMEDESGRGQGESRVEGIHWPQNAQKYGEEHFGRW
jgi:hypothetical protein